MFRHVVLFRWNDDVDETHIALVESRLDALPAAIPEIRDYRHGADAGLAEGNFDYVVVGDFDSVDDYMVYRDHAAHQALISDVLAGRISERAAVQHELEG